MTALRHLMAKRRSALLAFVLAALGMNALVPAGLMLAPSPAHGASIILCPQTHPLARAAAALPAPDLPAPDPHAAMGHDAAGGHDHHHHHNHHHHHHHAAGADAPDDDSAPPASHAAKGAPCAFAGLALAALLPASIAPPAPPVTLAALHPVAARPLRLAPLRHLRPPLRGPPSAI
ncbi:MAG: hypothetical protein ACXIT4_01550 [Erythrobacter sp.]